MPHCSIQDCKSEKTHALGFCRNHYYQHYKRQKTYLDYAATDRAIELRRATDRRRYYREKNNPKRSIKKQAYAKVHQQILKGNIIPRPCEVCGAKAHAHHDSYLPENWLKLRWLCPPHHCAWHRENEAEYPYPL